MRPRRSTGVAGSMKRIAARTACTWLLLLVLTGPSPGLAQQDSTGTNPANFTYDFRLITELWIFGERTPRTQRGFGKLGITVTEHADAKVGMMD